MAAAGLMAAAGALAAAGVIADEGGRRDVGELQSGTGLWPRGRCAAGAMRCGGDGAAVPPQKWQGVTSGTRKFSWVCDAKD
jgi:hypothetical protein